MAKLQLIKEVKNGALYQDADGNPFIRLEGCRASYPFLGTPSSDENDNGDISKKWRIVFMLPKKTHRAIYDLIVDVIEDIMKDEKATVPKDRWFVKNGDESDDENMHDHWLVSCSDGKYRPKCRDVNNQVIDDVDEIDNTFYGGCWVHGLIRPWFFAGKSRNSKKPLPKRICSGVSSVVFMDDDKPFGAGRVDDGDVWGDDDSGSMDDTPRRSRRGRDDDGDDDRSSRRSRDDDDSGSRRRGRDDDDRGSRRSRDDDDDRSSRSSRRNRDDDDPAAGL